VSTALDHCRSEIGFGLFAEAESDVSSTLPLLLGFDDVPSDNLGCLLTLGCEVGPGLRFVERHRIIHAIPFGDAHPLGSRPALNLNNPSARGAKSSTMRGLYRLASARQVRGQR
jgi:hypothetical protein